MDPFVFDQMFARFAAQVDSGAMAAGTELYESGAVRLDSLFKASIRGSISEKRDGIFHVRLEANEAGGLSGSCSCPEFFNCSHAYALARAARDRVLGTSPRAGARQKKSEGSPVQKELERVWKFSRQSGYVLYPKDLYKLVLDRRSLGVSDREPIRDLKRALQSESPRSLEDFASILHAYLEFRGIETVADFSPAKRRTPVEFGFGAVGKGYEWDRPALKLRVRIDLEEMQDRDWFQARAGWGVEGGGFTSEEIHQLRAAKGALVRLAGKGWHRLESELRAEEADVLSTLGLDPERNNGQRVHLCQVEDLLPETMLEEELGKSLRLRAKRLLSQGPPKLPPVLQGVLRPYQTEGFSYLCGLSRLGLGGILADDMGLGKTLQTLAWMLWLAEGKQGALRALVVCPKSVTDNWLQEPVKFRTRLSSRRFERANQTLDQVNIVVVNYAQLRLNAEQLIGERWDVVVLDEAQHIKSPQSQTSKVAFKLKAGHRIALTGTPVENSLTDLWSIMRFAMPRLLGPLPAFQANYGTQGGEQGLLALRRRMRPFLLRRLKREVAKELPERIEKDVYCYLEGRQRDRYDEELAVARSLLRSAHGEGGSLNVLQALLRLRQICCDPQLLDTIDEEEKELSAKVQALFDLLEPLVAEGHKVLVFSQFVRMLEIVEKELPRRGIRSLKLVGKTENRGELVERFQGEEGEPVFLLSLKAAGSGLTLTAASYVVLLDPWWNPAVEAQAIDRAHRIGQTNQVIAYRILAKDTVEEKIRKIQHEKAELAVALFGEGSLDSKIKIEDLEELFG